MEEHQRNAIAVGRFLEQHPQVLSVRFPSISDIRHALNHLLLRCPSLASHPQHELAQRQQFGHSGMLSFYINGGLEHSKRFLSALKVDIINPPTQMSNFSLKRGYPNLLFFFC